MGGLLFSGMGLLQIVISVFCVLLCLTVHEVAHGFAAYKLGDPTAKNMGRLTLNPIPHIDIVGGLALLFFGFGWAKPVMVDPRNFTRKFSMRNGMAITAFAGPLSNLIFALASVLTFSIVWSVMNLQNLPINAIFLRLEALELEPLTRAVLLTLQTLVFMNLGLAVFNLIPVPPLDGSKILSAWLPDRVLFKYAQIERYGFFLLILALNLPVLRGFLSNIMLQILRFYTWVIGLIPFL